MKNNLIVLIALLVTPFSLKAATISYNGYTLNTTNNIVTGAGLDWLQWDETAGQSADFALGAYGTLGWRLASNAEMAVLFNSFSFGAQDFDSLENTSDYRSYAWNSDENSSSNHFISLFGDTYKAAGIVTDYGELLEGTYAVFGQDEDGDGNINRGGVTDDYINREFIETYGSAFMFYDDTPFTSSPFATYGVALVRTSVVPLPPAILLFISGLIALLSIKSKKA